MAEPWPRRGRPQIRRAMGNCAATGRRAIEAAATLIAGLELRQEIAASLHARFRAHAGVLPRGRADHAPAAETKAEKGLGQRRME
jgi:hypothetical protein